MGFFGDLEFWFGKILVLFSFIICVFSKERMVLEIVRVESGRNCMIGYFSLLELKGSFGSGNVSLIIRIEGF